MKKLVRMTSNNQVAVPTVIARILKLEKGCYLEVEEKNRKIIMTPKKMIDAEDFNLYERAVRKGRTELKNGQATAWTDVKKSLRSSR